MSMKTISLSNILVLVAGLICAPNVAEADEVDLPAPSQGEFRLEADIFSMFLEDGTPYEEIVLRFPTSQLKFYRQASGNYLAEYRPELIVRDTNGEIVRQLGGGISRFELRTEMDTQDPLRTFTDMVQIQLPPGTYEGELRIEDTHSGAVGRQVLAIHVPAREEGRLAVSDIYLAERVDPAAGERLEIFRKGGRIIVPDPIRTFSTSVAFYATVRNLARRTHTVHFQVIDRDDQVVLDDRRSYPGYRNVAHLVEGFSLRDLLPGTYRMRVRVKAGEDERTIERAFLVDGPTPLVSDRFDEATVESMARVLTELTGQKYADTFLGLEDDRRAAYLHNHLLARNPLLHNILIGPTTGRARHEVTPELLGSLALNGALRKRVDPVYAERLPEYDPEMVAEAGRIVDLLADDSNPVISLAEALYYYHAGDVPRGQVIARRVEKAHATLPEVAHALGIGELGRGEWKKAARHFRHVLTLSPERTDQQIYVELARFLDGGTDGESAIDVIRKSVVHDNSNPWLYYLVGRTMEFKEKNRLDEAEGAYKRQITVHPQHGRARFDLARVFFKRESHEAAISLWRELMDARPEFREECALQLLDAYQKTRHTAGAQQVIVELLRSVDEETRNLLEDIRLVASPDEANAYAATPEEGKGDFVRSFWQKRDPTPATPGNERLVEHYRRVLYAMRSFSQGQKPWDRRGDIYIRYGEPAHASSRGNMRFETDQDVVNVKERLWQSLPKEAQQEIISRATRLRTSYRDVRIGNETGSDVDIGDFESIDFELDPLRGFFGTSSMNDDFNYYYGIQTTQADKGFKMDNLRGRPTYPVDGNSRWEYWIYPYVNGGIEVQFVSLSSKAPYDYPELPGGRELTTHNRGFWIERRPETVVSKAIINHPDVYDSPVETLDFHVDTADFNGTNEKTRLEVYYGVPLNDIVTSGRSEGALERGIALFDSTWTPIYRKVVPLPFRVDADTEMEKGTLVIDELALNIPPGQYWLGVQIDDREQGIQGAYTQELIVESYRKAGLNLSDIEMAGRVTDSDNPLKGGFDVLPLPSRTYRPRQPVTIYYEVYGLEKDEFGQTSYRMDYKIRPQRGKVSAVRVLRALGRLLGMEEKSVFSTSYERTGEEETEFNFLEIDMGKSGKGRFELEVSITDQNNGDTALKKAVFHVRD
ncbi:MAG: hypothetical protein CME26_10450 [Gemmatimonadetes bacterium]|nr:hypothetical protein [Gemmatimonadota bacterium]|tara:strand:- start:145 stop:3630 length:3486 start_codon:yes stop_codon:yes gene_type:complete